MEHYALPKTSLIGHAEIDDDHQTLIDLLNHAHCAVAPLANPAPSLIYPFLENLREGLKWHFHREEKEMARLGYPELAPHRFHHAQCIARLDEICDAVAGAQIEVGRDFLDELFDMILDDIIRADGGFKTYLQSCDRRVHA